MTTGDLAREKQLRQWLLRIACGDETALAQFYAETRRCCYALAFRILRNREDAEETVVDAFLQLWQTANQYDSRRGQVLSWLLLLVRSRALDRLRMREVRRRVEQSSVIEPLQPMSRTPESIQSAATRRAVLNGVLDRLPAAQRSAIALAMRDGLSQTEIANRLAQPLGTIKTRVRLGLLTMRRNLTAAFGSEDRVRAML